MYKVIKIVTMLTFAIFLSACEQQERGFSGYSDPDSPQYRAKAYFDALYNEPNLQLVMKHATDKHAKMVQSYVTPNAYSRHVLNMQFDPGVDIKIDRSFGQIQNNTSTTMFVNILFTGTHHGDKFNDLKQVSFVKHNDEWLISEIGKGT